MSLAYADLAAQADISRSYANEILSGARTPSRALAIHIYRKTGWRHSRLAGLTDADLDVFEREEPWTPAPKERAA